MKKWVFIKFILFISMFPVLATEIYVFSTDNCQQSTGVLIEANKNQIKILQENGRIKEINKSDIKNILIYQINLKKFLRGKISKDASRFFKRIRYLDKGKQKHFVGLFVKNIENIDFFYTTKGAMMILNKDQIDRIDSIEENIYIQEDKKSKKIELNKNTYAVDCSLKKYDSKAIRPFKIITDLVKISEFLSDFQNNYQDMEKFQERTHLYVRPFYYDKSTQLGFVFGKDSTTGFPLFFKWSKGSNYYFQSETLLGADYSKYIPHNKKLLMVKARLKSHFLNVSFEGNFDALSVGSSGSNLDWETPAGDLYIGYNHLFLLGGDYRKFTFKIGSIYVNTAFAKPNNFTKEILAIRPSPIYEINYTKRNWMTGLVFSQSNFKGQLKENVLVRQYYNDFSTEESGSFKYKNKYYKAFFQYDFDDKIILQANTTWIAGRHQEFINYQKDNYYFQQVSVAATVTRQFGHYIKLRFRANKVWRQINYANFTKSDNFNILGGSFAFIF